MSRPKINRQAGFTLIEMAVVVPAMTVVIAIFVAFLVNLFITTLKDTATAQLGMEGQLALISVQDDLYMAVSFADDKNSLTTDDNSADWTTGKTSANRLIVDEVELTTPRQDPTVKLVYLDAGFGCGVAQITNNPPLFGNIIYYVDSNNQLRKRILVPDPVHKRCRDPYRVQTCNDSTPTRLKTKEDGSTTTVTCPPDPVVAQGVTDFSVKYYDVDGVETTDLSLADHIQLSLTLEEKVNAEPISHTSTLVITKNNIETGIPDDIQLGS